MHRSIIQPLTIAFVVAAMMYGCGPGMQYHRRLADHLSAGECEQAAELVETSKDDYGANGELLYLLDGAMANFRCGDNARAQQRFQAAEQLAERLWTESLSANTLALLTNDYLLPYAGEDFERVMINLFAALSFLKAGQTDEALVECRRLDSLLTLYNSKYDEKNVYKEDAFARYLSGMLHEADKAMDDAYIDYAKAYHIYGEYQAAYGTPTPPILIEDLLRVAAATDRMEEVAEIAAPKEGPSPFGQEDALSMGRIVLIHLNGEAPEKQEDRIYLPTLGYGPLTIAFPRMEVAQPACRGSRLTLIAENGGRITADGFLAEDINRIAVKDLNDRKGRIIAKTMARAVAKQVAIHQIANANKNRGSRDLIITLFNLMNLLIEQTDTRSWRSLPGEIYLTRVFVPPGVYQVEAEALGCHGVPSYSGTVEVAAGETRYLVYDGG